MPTRFDAFPVDVSTLETKTLKHLSGGSMGFFGTTPVTQTSGSAQAAVTTAAPVSGIGYGFTYAQAVAVRTLLNEMRRVLVVHGIMPGS